MKTIDKNIVLTLSSIITAVLIYFALIDYLIVVSFFGVIIVLCWVTFLAFHLALCMPSFAVGFMISDFLESKLSNLKDKSDIVYDSIKVVLIASALFIAHIVIPVIGFSMAIGTTDVIFNWNDYSNSTAYMFTYLL